MICPKVNFNELNVKNLSFCIDCLWVERCTFWPCIGTLMRQYVFRIHVTIE